MTKLLSQHFRCTVLGIYYLWLYSCSLIAWPKLSCVYFTGKASGWFFRHEMSDLFSPLEKDELVEFLCMFTTSPFSVEFSHINTCYQTTPTECLCARLVLRMRISSYKFASKKGHPCNEDTSPGPQGVHIRGVLL